jgi:tRNA threonylcarbamoyladenosine biosynthesis protein TsaB
MSSRSIVLALETAVGGGSISILQEGTKVGTLDGNVSRAEEVLDGIDTVLTHAKVKLDEIDTIAVSRGPGSFTGIRIGIATALGLRVSLGAELVGVNALEAMSLPFVNGDRVSVLPLGRGNYVLQEFYLDDAGHDRGAYVVNERELTGMLEERSNDVFIFHKDVAIIGDPGSPRNNVAVCADSLSTLIARYAFEGNESERLSPLYIRDRSFEQTKSDRGAA